MSDITDRLDKLEAAAALNQLPASLAALQRKLELNWQPDATVLLQPASIGPEALNTTLINLATFGLVFNQVDTQQSTTSTSYTALTTAGPTVTVGRAADYLVGVGGGVANSSANQEAWMSYDIGGTGAVDADRVVFSSAAALAKTVAVARFAKKTLAAGTVLTAKYRVGGGTGTWEHRWLLAIPIT